MSTTPTTTSVVEMMSSGMCLPPASSAAREDVRTGSLPIDRRRRRTHRGATLADVQLAGACPTSGVPLPAFRLHLAEQLLDSEHERLRGAFGRPRERPVLDLREVELRRPHLHRACVDVDDPVQRHALLLVQPPLLEAVVTRA